MDEAERKKQQPKAVTSRLDTKSWGLVHILKNKFKPNSFS